jgi:hypothetical protein
MSTSAHQKLQLELDTDERLLWSGQPRQAMRFRELDVVWIPLSLFIGGSLFFFEYLAIKEMMQEGDRGFSLVLWGLPFVLIGVFFIVGRFFWDSYRRSRLYYGLTNRRVIILVGLRSRKVTSLALQRLNEISLKERSDKSGDIIFGPTIGLSQAVWSKAIWVGMCGECTEIFPTFELVENARQVYDMIRKAQQA